MTMHKSVRRWLVIAATVFGSAACSIQPPTPAQSGVSQSEHQALLSGYHWIVPTSISGVNTPVQLTFHDNRLSLTGLCNALGAGYTVKGASMDVGNVVSTMKMCADDDVMRAEQKLGKHLSDVTSWQIDQTPAQHAPMLTLGFSGADKWVLNGEPTNETRYGSAAETVFLEIKPQRMTCQHGAVGNHQCLVVRSVTYDDAGLKRDHGEWQKFYGEIDGYTHEPGIRNVVRLKRYTRAASPADASRFVYVLDMVVESENVEPS